MEFLTDWKFWLFILTVLGMIINAITHFRLVTNDLKHLSNDVKDIKKEQVCIKNKVIQLSEDVAKLKGKLE